MTRDVAEQLAKLPRPVMPFGRRLVKLVESYRLFLQAPIGDLRFEGTQAGDALRGWVAEYPAFCREFVCPETLSRELDTLLSLALEAHIEGRYYSLRQHLETMDLGGLLIGLTEARERP